MRVLAEIIASDVSLLVTFNQAIDGVIQNNQKARQNPKALAQLDSYQETAGEFFVGQSSAVRDGKSGESGIASGNHCGDDRKNRDQR